MASDDGPTAVEYAVMLAVFIAVLATALKVGQSLQGSYSSSGTEISSAMKNKP